MVNPVIKKSFKLKKDFSKLKLQNQKYYLMAPDYLSKKNFIRSLRAKNMRRVYFNKLSKMPFFKELLKNNKRLKLSVISGEKKFEYQLLRKGLRIRGAKEKALILFDKKGRSMLLGEVNISQDKIWYPVSFVTQSMFGSKMIKKIAKDIPLSENKAFFSISDQINANMKKMSFIELENVSQFSNKIKLVRDYL